MAIEIVDLPMKNGGSFHGYVSLPEGKLFEHVESPFFKSHVLIRVLELLDQRDGVRFSKYETGSNQPLQAQCWKK